METKSSNGLIDHPRLHDVRLHHPPIADPCHPAFNPSQTRPYGPTIPGTTDAWGVSKRKPIS
jgi:hypothetical protein